MRALFVSILFVLAGLQFAGHPEGALNGVRKGAPGEAALMGASVNTLLTGPVFGFSHRKYRSA